MNWPAHLQPVPAPDPRDSIDHLEMLLGNATETFGADSLAVSEIRGHLKEARRRLTAALTPVQSCAHGKSGPQEKTDTAAPG